MIKSKYEYNFSPILFAVVLILVSLFLPLNKAQSRGGSPAHLTVVIIPPGNPIEIAIANSSIVPEAVDIPLAVAMAINDYGPIKGFSAQALEYDTGCDGLIAADTALTIIANHQHVGVIGPLCSSSVPGALPIFESAGLVTISGSTTGPDLHLFGQSVFNRTAIEDPMLYGWDLIVGGLGSVAEWENDFEVMYTHPPWNFARYAYDATTLLLTRIDEVSNVDGGGNLVINRRALATAVRNTFNFEGVTGNIALHTTGTRVNEYQLPIWADGFNDSDLNPAWSWIDENPSHWSLTKSPGYMQILTQWPTRNRLVRPIPEGDFEIRTTLAFTPTENFQFAGLTVYLGDGNLMNFGRAYCDLGPPTCLDNAIYFDLIEGGIQIGDNFPMTTTLTEETHLRIIHEGGVYFASVSTNGIDWLDVGAHEPGFMPESIGLYSSGQGSPTQIPAKFDFFVLESTVKNLFLPIMNH